MVVCRISEARTGAIDDAELDELGGICSRSSKPCIKVGYWILELGMGGTFSYVSFCLLVG